MMLNTVARGPDAPGGRSRPPVVLVHGLFGRARNLASVQRRLAPGRRTLAVDLRSHGDSPHGRIDYPALAGDLLETLEAQLALPAMLVGHSMGGKAAMMLALARPDAVAGLLVADIPPADTDAHGTAALAGRLLRLRFPPTLDRTGADALLAGVIPEPAVRQLMLGNLRLGADPGWSIGLAEIVASMTAIEGWPALPDGTRYDGPTLFLAGEASGYIRPEHHPAMRRLFPAHRLEVVERAGHWLHADNFQRFMQLVEGFVAIPPPEPP